ncbi:hypothetical protein RB195_008279 [Necator americanus]
MYPSMFGLLCVMLFVSGFLQIQSLPSTYLCKGRKRGENCFVMVNLLRGPHQSPNWSISSWNRALNQQKAYQQLFQDFRRRKRSVKYVRWQQNRL